MNDAKTKQIQFRIVKFIRNIVDALILILILALLIFAAYALWDSNSVFESADAANYEKYNPENDKDDPTFDELVAINAEVFGWITIYGTGIDYPLTQAEDNAKYVNTNALGEYSLAGSIFLDYQNSKDFTDFNSIFYGHHMEKSAMFGDLGLFKDEKYFKEHLWGNLYANGRDYGLEIFSMIRTDAYDHSIFVAKVEGEDRQLEYLENIRSKSTNYRDIGISINDKIVLLTTCTTAETNGRDIVVARLTNEKYRDTFEKPAKRVTFTTVERLIGFPMWIFTLGLPLSLIIILTIILYHREKRKHIQRSKRSNI